MKRQRTREWKWKPEKQHIRILGVTHMRSIPPRKKSRFKKPYESQINICK